jgi:hypothetical protein
LTLVLTAHLDQLAAASERRQSVGKRLGFEYRRQLHLGIQIPLVTKTHESDWLSNRKANMEKHRILRWSNKEFFFEFFNSCLRLVQPNWSSALKQGSIGRYAHGPPHTSQC